MIDKLCLGSAQFGLDYGIANKRGMPPPADEVFAILAHAQSAGIDSLDTAGVYGSAENLIGDYLKIEGSKFKVISKSPAFDEYIPGMIGNHCTDSLKRLKQRTIYGYLIRNAEDILKSDALWQEAGRLKSEGFVEKIGVSIYRTGELEKLMRANVNFDILQTPFNIFDQRFAEYFPSLKNKGVEIHTRSVFLQGLFFLKRDLIDAKFPGAKDQMQKLHVISNDFGIPINALCLGYAMQNPFVDKVIIGVETLEQLQENIGVLAGYEMSDDLLNRLGKLKCDDEDIILPFRWAREKVTELS